MVVILTYYIYKDIFLEKNLMIPYDKREGKIWYNNDLVEWQDVKLHVVSHGLHYGSFVFEGL